MKPLKGKEKQSLNQVQWLTLATRKAEIGQKVREILSQSVIWVWWYMFVVPAMQDEVWAKMPDPI
jgi:hypothetical protein